MLRRCCRSYRDLSWRPQCLRSTLRLEQASKPYVVRGGIRTLCIGRLTLLTGRLTAVAVVGASRALVAPPSSCDVLQAAGCGGGGLDWLTGLMAAVSLPSGSSAWRCEQHRIGIWREDGGSMLFWQRVGLTEKALHFLTLPPAPTAQCGPSATSGRSGKSEMSGK